VLGAGRRAHLPPDPVEVIDVSSSGDELRHDRTARLRPRRDVHLDRSASAVVEEAVARVGLEPVLGRSG
jgi:hypothetical protein